MCLACIGDSFGSVALPAETMRIILNWQMQEAKFRFQSRSWSSNHASGRRLYWDGFTPIASDWTEWKVMENRLCQGAETGKCPHTCNVKHIRALSYLHHDLGLKETKRLECVLSQFTAGCWSIRPEVVGPKDPDGIPAGVCRSQTGSQTDVVDCRISI